ncbi:unnamed protein product [Prunus armeniaca]|uniref:Uncharacterized protein n=1 Tax=Prunus armeniaca TaxID=36596 RepID=A0A6J5TUY0_PRUAR|nr:unnamed protein product [Prunus armeniaca]
MLPLIAHSAQPASYVFTQFETPPELTGNKIRFHGPLGNAIVKGPPYAVKVASTTSISSTAQATKLRGSSDHTSNHFLPI